MKKIINKIFVVVMVSTLMLTSCIGDLDTIPLNDTDYNSENAYKDEASYLNGLSYIYGYWALVSQNNPGSSDLAFDDAGQSELTRMYMILNELSTDALKSSWTDSYISAIQYNSWSSANNAAIIAVYTRCMKGITLVNEFLLQTAPDKLEARGHSSFADKINIYRAEAKFNRALFYYILLDLYGNPPMATEANIGGENPSQILRPDLYIWIEAELNALLEADSKMPIQGQVEYPRATQASVYAVLTRLYLNAEIYTGTPQWEKTKDASEKAIVSFGKTLYQDYHKLFMQDNTETGAAAAEFIVGVSYDTDFTQSWGGATHLVCGSLPANARKEIATALGIEGNISPASWNGYHVADDYVQKFNLADVNWNETAGVGKFGYDKANSDKRAFFYNIGSKEEFDNSTIESGWWCWKFSGLRSNKTVSERELSSIDFPIIRLAEMYMAYAEADAHLNGGVVSDQIAIDYIQKLRVRAGVPMPATSELTLDWILDERAREFMWEGQRRTDLIRHKKFTSMQYPWTLKGGIMSGQVAIPAHMTIFPIISSELNVNSNLKQNLGY